MSSRRKGELLITIEDDLYEVSKFLPVHPGEGIHDVYLNAYNRKNVTEEYEHYHFDDQPDEWLNTAKEKGFDPETGIYFVGPIGKWFKKRIPVWFHFFPNEDVEEAFWTANVEKDKVFIVKTLPKETVTTGATLIIKEGDQKQKILLQKGEKWRQEETIQDTLEQLVDVLAVKKGFSPL
eukprot:TRINITY_DN1187_c0_g1_i1.p1 TRINITY_DN1187_c0_g1~~TRINITY_DN1187_c0_g1_i1.p1  ORF type:complete len:179 (-),score=47.21 TRINITY_DN1187_c0_g1_i1:22-558(-)